LLNDSTIADTDGAMSSVVETAVPGVDGYNRQIINAADWSAPVLDLGDMQTAAAEKTFGPITVASKIATHAAVCSAATGTAAVLFLTVLLSATTTIGVGQSFRYILRQKTQ
jgi:hypothetical protein